jgi:Plasmid pRiA4b ORF-3-like protein
VHRRRHGCGRPVRGRALKAPAQAAGSTTHVLRASFKPKIYRDIEIEGSRSLAALAEAVVMAFDFEFDHAFGYYSDVKDPYSRKGERYELFADMEDGDSDAGSVERTTVAQVFHTPGKKMLFVFDYGDDWRFLIEAKATGEIAPKARYPRLVASVGNAPEQYPDDDEE